MRLRTLTAGSAAVALAVAARLALGLADIPPTSFAPPGPPPQVPPLLERTHDLLRMFAEGDGALERARPGLVPSGRRVTALPWRVAPGREGAVQIHWDAEENRRQGTTIVLLMEGQRWCTPRISAARDARLRLEALALDARKGRLVVGTSAQPAPVTVGDLPGGPEARAVDLPLPEGAAEICLAAEGGTVGVAEPRVLAPVPPGDGRPRWVVLAISDSLRADAWRGPDAAVIAPRAAAFAATARRYEDARAPGSHTAAAMWPIFTGRDLMRVAPAMRLNPFWGTAVPLDAARVFSLPNVFLPQYAESAGYRTAFFGNNTWVGGTLPTFGRFALQGSGRTGTYDGARELPAFLARYADERLLLVYWTSAAHRGADLAQRLANELGCGTQGGLEQLRCEYRARVRHNDEGVGALLDGLAYYGVRDQSLVVLTADHGDALEDGWTLEAPDPEDGLWKRLDSGHGSTTGTPELAVPLLVSGPGIAPGSWTGRVSTLDVVPTLVAAMGSHLAGRVDGQVLPLFPGGTTDDGSARRLVAYGFCGHSDAVGDRQLVWWDGSACPIRRRPGESALLTGAFELRVKDALVPAPPASEIGARRRAHAEWLAERFVGETIVLDPAALPPGSTVTVTVTAPEGRIVDHGPSGSRWGLERIGPAAASADGRTVQVRFDGYRGLYAVTTRPVRTKVSVQVTGAAPAMLVGPYQLPVDAAAGPIDPAARPDYVVSAREPARQPAAGPVLRLWWQPYEPVVAPAGSAAMEEFNRVLRDWGYIR